MCHHGTVIFHLCTRNRLSAGFRPDHSRWDKLIALAQIPSSIGTGPRRRGVEGEGREREHDRGAGQGHRRTGRLKD